MRKIGKMNLKDSNYLLSLTVSAPEPAQLPVPFKLDAMQMAKRVKVSVSFANSLL
jgi:hypothetical protein